MDRTNFFPDQRVTKDDLNYIESSKIKGMKQLVNALLTLNTQTYSASIGADFQRQGYGSTPASGAFRGIIGNPRDNQLLISTGSVSQIFVSSGWGLTNNMDLLILTGSVTVNKGDNTFNRYWLSVPSATMYITLEYQDSSGSVGNDSSGNSYYSRFYSDWAVKVTTIPPSGINQLPLGTFTSDGSGDINGAIVDNRIWIRPLAFADTTWLAAVGASPSTPVAGWNSVQDHVNAIGTGTASQINAHGLSINDIGYVDNMPKHRLHSHANGIGTLGNYNSTSYAGVVTSPGVPDYITFLAPSNAVMSVSGSLFEGPIVGTLYANLTSAPGGTGDYFVVATNSGATLIPQFVASSSVSFNEKDPNKYSQYVRIGFCHVDTSLGLITNYQDKREFFTLAQTQIRMDREESVLSCSGSIVSSVTGSLRDNLDRIRYAIGMAAHGFPSGGPGTGSLYNWNNGFPLTNGSNADRYHTHSSTNWGSEVTNSIDPPNNFNTNYANPYASTMFLSAVIGQTISGGWDRPVADLCIGPSNVVPLPYRVSTISIRNDQAGDFTFFEASGSITALVPPYWWWRLDTSRTIANNFQTIASISTWH